MWELKLSGYVLQSVYSIIELINKQAKEYNQLKLLLSGS